MIVGIPTESVVDETRVALVPDLAASLIESDIDVVVAAGAGELAGWSDERYREVGCSIVDDRSGVFEAADVVVQVRALAGTPDDEMDPYGDGQVVVGQLGPYALDGELEVLADRGVSAFSLDLVPRISRAQSMDVQSSMASIGGYKAALVAAEALPKLFPMQMTAAGTVRPAEVFVVGAGVAGLQAIATAGRLGATVRAYDIRPEVKTEVESLGATFVELDLEADDAADDEGHARAQDEAFYRKQREMMIDVVGGSDVVITTAAIPGRPSPELVTTEMIEGMDDGSVIVDLAAAGGGNCEPTRADEVVTVDGVRIFGPTNLPGTVARTASRLYATNVVNFLELLIDDGELAFDVTDEIVDATLLVHDGTVRNPHVEEEESTATGGDETADGDESTDAIESVDEIEVADPDDPESRAGTEDVIDSDVSASAVEEADR